MKAITITLLLVSFAHAQLKVATEHKLIPKVTSPFTVRMEVEAEYYHFLLVGSLTKQENGDKCTFEALPGVHVVRAVALGWVGGELKPIKAVTSHVLITDEPQASPSDKTWRQPVTLDKETIVEAVKQALAPQDGSKWMQGVTIQMKTTPGCAPCARWKREEKHLYTNVGASVVEVQPEAGELAPQFRILWNGKATTWDNRYLTNAICNEHLRNLGWKR